MSPSFSAFLPPNCRPFAFLVTCFMLVLSASAQNRMMLYKDIQRTQSGPDTFSSEEYSFWAWSQVYKNPGGYEDVTIPPLLLTKEMFGSSDTYSGGIEYPTLSALDAAYPDGGSIVVNVKRYGVWSSSTLPLPPPSKRTVPLFTNFSEIQAINTAAPFTFRWTPVIGLSDEHHGLDGQFWIHDITTDTYVDGVAFSASTSEFTLPADKLDPTHTYRGTLEVWNWTGGPVDLHWGVNHGYYAKTELVFGGNYSPTPVVTMHRVAKSTDVANLNGGPDDPLIPIPSPSQLSQLPVIQKGVVADGVTPVILKIVAPGAENNSVSLVAGPPDVGAIAQGLKIFCLREGAWEEGNEVTIDEDSGTGYAYVEGIPSEAITASSGSAQIGIGVPIAAVAGSKTVYFNLRVRKPPLVLIHGTASNNNTWSQGFRDEFTSRGISVVPVAWGQSDNGTVNLPFSVLAGEINARLVMQMESDASAEVPRHDWAMTRYDILGHSQGGLLVRMLTLYLKEGMERYFTGQVSFRNPGNFNRGRFRRIVTIGATHNGTTLAKWMLEMTRTVPPNGMNAIRNVIVAVSGFAIPKFDPYDTDLAKDRCTIHYVNHPAFVVDDAARFHLVSTRINSGTVSSLAPVYALLGIPQSVIPHGSDGVVEPESTQAGFFPSNSSNPQITLWTEHDISHAGPPPFFGILPEFLGGASSQTNNRALATHVSELLDRKDFAFGKFEMPVLRTTAERIALESSVPNILSIDGITKVLDPFPIIRTGSLPQAQVSDSFTITPVPSNFESGTVVWSASVFGIAGQTTEGVTVSTDSSNPFVVSVQIDEALVGDVVLSCSYTDAQGNKVFYNPVVVATRHPQNATLTGIEFKGVPAAAIAGNTFIPQLWRVYEDGTKVMAYFPGSVQSDSSQVLSVTMGGLIEARAAGTAIISLDHDGLRASKSVTVQEPNEVPPLLVPDRVDSHGEALLIDVLENDHPGFGALTLVGATPGAHGSVTISGNSVVYTPDDGFELSEGDRFEYSASNGAGTIRSTGVIIGKRNAAPVARPDFASYRSGAFLVPVLQNDDDDDGDSLAIVDVDQPVEGVAEIVPGGIRLSFQTGSSDPAQLRYTIRDTLGAENVGVIHLLKAGEDTDRDGQSNEVEIIGGSSPIDANAQFRIGSIKHVGTVVSLSWNGRAGSLYRVEVSEDLSSWNPLSPWLAGALNMEYSGSASPADKAFYRVSVTDASQ